MKEKTTSKIFILLLILLSLVFTACGQYKPSNSQLPGWSSSQNTQPEIINYKDGEYSLVESYEHNDYKAVNYFSKLNGFHADGKNDDSQNLQNLLNKAAQNGGGSVYVSKGIYLLEKPITIPENVTLTGDFKNPKSTSGIKDCTVFIVAENEETLQKTLFTLSENSALNEITVYYRDRNFESLKEYPYTIEHRSGSTTEIKDIAIINASKGIFLSSIEATDIVISNVYMTATTNGIYALNCKNKLELYNIFIDPSIWFNCELVTEKTDIDSLSNRIKNTLIGLTLSTISDIYADDITINTCYVGLKTDIPDITTKVPLISNLTINDAQNALLLISAPKTGIAFAKCSLRTDSSYNSADIKIHENYSSPTVFNSCSFRGNPSNIIYSEGSSMLSFVGCSFISWQETAINSTDRIISVSGGNFNKNGDIIQTKNSTVGIFALNRIYSEIKQEISQVFTADIKNEYSVDKISDTWLEDLTIEFTIPTTIYNAEDYGVNETSEDNTVALQMAINRAAENGGGTVFINKGTFKFSSQIQLKKGVKLQGAGKKITNLIFDSSESDSFITCEGNNKIAHLALECSEANYSENSTDNLATAVFSQNDNIEISDVNFTKVNSAIRLSQINNVTVKNISATAITEGIYAEKCNFVKFSNIRFTTNGLSADVINAQHENFIAVKIRECSGTVCENLSSNNGDYLVYLNSEKVDIIPEEPSVTITGLFAENVYSAFAVNKYDFASIVNVSSKTEIYGQNAYHATTFAENSGKLCVYNVIGNGSATGGIYLRGGSVSIQSCIFNTCGTSAIKNEGSEAEIVGCIFLDTNVTYHAQSSSGSTAFIANIINSTAEFDGINKSYVRSYTLSDALFADEYNLIPIN